MDSEPFANWRVYLPAEMLCLLLCLMSAGIARAQTANSAAPSAERKAPSTNHQNQAPAPQPHTVKRPGQSARHKPHTAHRCENVAYRADQADCGPENCLLRGHVVLWCDNLRLWADTLDLRWDEKQQFAGARAEGKVTLIDEDTVLTCRSLTLDADQVHGRVHDAELQLSQPGAPPATLHGNIERLGPEQYRVQDADFTLCRCDAGSAPSWRLDASSIDIDRGDKSRATLWWPVLRISPFGWGPIPITPPLLPLSIPLESRAAGFLAPSFRILDLPWPMLDLPFFLPLGRSYDLTLTPGLRTDWGSRESNPATWGAPRLGGRLRYHPRPQIYGELQTRWTWDRQNAGRDPSLNHRVAIEWEQRVDLNKRTRWLVQSEWISDDLFPREFELVLEERVRDYLPSRSQVLWRRPGMAFVTAVDHLLRSSGQADPSNFFGPERSSAHRGPHLAYRVLPLALGSDLHAEGAASFSRYGSWSRDGRQPLILAQMDSALSWNKALGPLRTHARLSGHGLWADTDRGPHRGLSFVQTEVELSSPLGRALNNDGLHLLRPFLRYRGLPAHSRVGLKPEVSDALLIEESLEVHRFHQLQFGVAQKLRWGRRREIEISVAQPVDLETLSLMAGRLEAGVRWSNFSFRGDAFVLPTTTGTALQAITLDAATRFWLLSLNASYTRWSPNTERFVRNIYELAGSTRVLSSSGSTANDALWVHSARGGLSLGNRRARLGYKTVFLLPLPGGQDNALNEDRPSFTRHLFTASYQSPCECWGIKTVVDVPGDDPSDFRLQISLSVN